MLRRESALHPTFLRGGRGDCAFAYDRGGEDGDNECRVGDGTRANREPRPRGGRYEGERET